MSPKYFFRSITVILAASLSATALAPSSAANESPRPVTDAFIDLRDASFGLLSSRVHATTSRGNSAPPDSRLCEGLSGACELSSANTAQVSANLNLTTCESAQEIDCIASVALNGKELKISSLPGLTVQGDTKTTLAQGAGPTLLTSSTGDKFLLSVKAEYRFDKEKRAFEPRALDAMIRPVLEVAGEFADISLIQSQRGDGSGFYSETGSRPECLWNSLSICLQESGELNVAVAISLDLQLSSKWSGFFKGRLGNPELQVKRVGLIQKVKVSASPISSQKVYFKFDPAALTQTQHAALCAGTTWCEAMSPTYAGTRNYLSSAPQALAILPAFGQFHKDTAHKDTVEWSFGVGRMTTTGCLAPNKGLLGLVTSNAPVFQAGPPTFSSGSLTYDVAGLHYTSDGDTLFLGEYDLQLRSDVARCLYGFSSAPISATVSVLTDRGNQVVATSSVGEFDGWLRLSAKGFTFSKKRVKVTLSQPLNTVLPKFTGNSATLIASQKSAVRYAIASRPKGELVTCSVGYQLPSQRPLANRRAESICAFAKTVNKGIRTEAGAYRVALPVEVGATLIRSK